MAEPNVTEEVSEGRGGYPFYPLSEVETFVKEIHSAGGWEVGEDVAYERLYKKGSPRLNRWWKYKVASAREFGLVERVGRAEEAKIRLTKLSRRLVMPESESDLADARRACFFSCELYRKLHTRYADGPLPPLEGVSNVLVREYGLVASVAPTAAQAFENSLTTAGLVVDGRVTVSKSAQPSPPLPPSGEPNRELLKPEIQLAQADVGREGFIRHRFNLRRGMVLQVELPEDLTQVEVNRISKWLSTLPLEEEGAS